MGVTKTQNPAMIKIADAECRRVRGLPLNEGVRAYAALPSARNVQTKMLLGAAAAFPSHVESDVYTRPDTSGAFVNARSLATGASRPRRRAAGLYRYAGVPDDKLDVKEATRRLRLCFPFVRGRRGRRPPRPSASAPRTSGAATLRVGAAAPPRPSASVPPRREPPPPQVGLLDRYNESLWLFARTMRGARDIPPHLAVVNSRPGTYDKLASGVEYLADFADADAAICAVTKRPPCLRDASAWSGRS